MASAIDELVPPFGNPTTAAVRANFAAAKAEIEALQAETTALETGAVAMPKIVALQNAHLKLTPTQGGAESYGWKDLLGDVTPKTSGVGAPTMAAWSGNLRGFHYSAGDDGDITYHIPHDYAPGTDLFIHMHWLHNGTNISGQFNVTLYASYAKGHGQAAFHAEKAIALIDSALSIGNTPSLHHRLPEVQLSTPGGAAALLNTTDIEPDGIIQIHYDVTAIPTITGGTGEPFILTMDIHYQTTMPGTINRAPPFRG
jgi:hypothetical protein